VALVVEDGSGLPNAEAYISAADADAYFAARNNSTWAAIPDQATKEAYLRQGCEWMEARYRWQGVRATALTCGSFWEPATSTTPQALSWPRKRVIIDGVLLPYTAVPLAIIRANAELALRASTGELAPDETAQIVRETIGPITTEYQPGHRQAAFFAQVEAMVASYTVGGSGCAVIRA